LPEAEVDFISAFWMLHEAPDPHVFLEQLHGRLRAEGHLFLAEPKLHVRRDAFDRTLRICQALGFEAIAEPRVAISHAAVLRRAG
jgi:2-polyprenyl-3-methyl-5-hydroxy-6-metoxy-1,4-benzoquinol methylase